MLYSYIYQPEFQANCLSLRLSGAHPSLSRLDFHVGETPYSAYITVRKKFSHHFKPELCTNMSNCEQEAKVDASNFFKAEIEALTKDKDKLSRTIKIMKEAHEDETDKVKVKLEEQTKQFKVVKGEHAAIENDSKTWNKVMKAKEKEIYNLTKENEEIKDKLEISKKDIVQLNWKINKDKKESERKDKKDKKKETLDTLQTETSSLGFPCKVCDVKSGTLDQLKSHDRNYHMKTSLTQTEDIVLVHQATQAVQDPPFSIPLEIKPPQLQNVPQTTKSLFKPSQSKLPEIPPNFPGHTYQTPAFFPPVGFSLPSSRFGQGFPYSTPNFSHLHPKCEYCGWIANCGTDLMQHKRNVHNDTSNPFDKN